MGKAGKNKNGVKNSLVNNINARKRKGKSRPKKKSTISKKSYAAMKDNWGKARKRSPAKKAGKQAVKKSKKPSKKRVA
jgi:hypothetical protein